MSANRYRRPQIDRLLEKIERDPVTGCWNWTGARDVTGYGRFGYYEGNGPCRTLGAHRVAYLLLVGQIPDGLQLDHLCRNPKCVNPAHLEPVTGRENTLRGNTIPAACAKKTHCLRGHPFDEDNTYFHKGVRHCRTCISIRGKAQAERTAK